MNDINRKIIRLTPAEINSAYKLAFDKRFFLIQARYDWRSRLRINHKIIYCIAIVIEYRELNVGVGNNGVGSNSRTANYCYYIEKEFNGANNVKMGG